MKKAKKLLVTLLVFAFVLSTFTVGFAATSSAKVTDKDLPKEVVRAMALGYLKGDDQGNLNLDKPITRAEALAIVVRISGLETSASLMKGQTKFADVNADPSLQWATGYINLGVGQGIINGYPDGTFRGNANVTYAEMAKMLLYAMNYGVTVEGAPWPAGVMGKADDLGLFDKVSAAPDAPAIRGDVVKMVDNSLTVAHLKQTGYGDLKQYEEDENTTFLSKMKVDELDDARVTAIARVDSTLEDDEIELTEYDSKGNEINSDVYTLLTDETPEALFGLKVDAWINDDDEIVFVDISTNAKDILLDTVTGTPAKDEIELKVADDTFDVASDAKAYVNFDPASDFSKIPEGAYGKFVREKGKIAFANLFDFDKKGVVTEVDKNVIKFVDVTNGDDDEIDLDDYDDIYVYNPDFSKADVKDIEEYSAIFYWADGDEINIVVKNDSVEGKVDAVKADSIKIDGTWYDKGIDAVVTLDKGDNYDEWKGLDNIEDFVDEDVTAVLDLNGEVMLVTGAAKATSGNLYGLVTYAKDGRYVTLTVFNKEGKEVDYTAESSTEFRDPVVGSKLLTDLNYYALKGNVEYAALKYKLTSANEIAKEKSVVAGIKGYTLGNTVSYDSSVTASDVVFSGNLEKGTDKKVIYLGSKSFYITSDTVIIQALNSDGELDPGLISVDKFVSSGISTDTSNPNKNKAVVFGEAGKDADLIVMLNEDFEGAEEDYYYGVVTDKPYKSGGSYYAKINVFGEGEKDYKIADVKDFQKGDVVAFNFNNKDEATLKEDRVKSGTVKSYEDGYIKIEEGTTSETYKVDSSVVLYNKDTGDALDKKISRTKLKDYVDHKIDFAFDDSRVLVAGVVYDKIEPGAGGGGGTTGVVTYIDADDKAVTKQTIVAGDSLNLTVKFNNTTDKNVSIPKEQATFQIVNDKTGAVVTVADNKLNASDLVALAGKSVELGSISETITTAGDYTVIVTVKDANNNVYEGELALKVLSTDASAKEVKVKGVKGTGASPTFAVVLPYGSDLTKVSASDVVVTPNDDNATVGTATTTDNGTTWKVVITAEDGETTATITINMSVAGINPSSAVTPASQEVAVDTPATITVVLKDTAGNIVSGVANKFNITFTGAADPATVTISSVTETGNTGVYTFTAKNSAANETVTLTIEVDGVTLITTPKVVTPAP